MLRISCVKDGKDEVEVRRLRVRIGECKDMG